MLVLGLGLGLGTQVLVNNTETQHNTVNTQYTFNHLIYVTWIFHCNGPA